MATEAQKKASKKYLQKNNLVEIKFRVTSEERASIYEQIERLGYASKNTFIVDAINEKLARELSQKHESSN